MIKSARKNLTLFSNVFSQGLIPLISVFSAEKSKKHVFEDLLLGNVRFLKIRFSWPELTSFEIFAMLLKVLQVLLWPFNVALSSIIFSGTNGMAAHGQ